MYKLSKGLTSLVVAFAAVATLATGGVLPAAATEHSSANAEIGYPHFGGVDNPIPASGQAYDPSAGYLSKVFDKDLSQGAGTDTDHDFWIDRILTRKGNQPTGKGTNDAGTYTYEGADTNQYLFSRGRAAYMRTHEPSVFGFGGEVAYKDTISSKGAFTVDFYKGQQKLTVHEVADKRKQTPSYWRGSFETNDPSLSMELVKYITNDNVLVAQYRIINKGGANDVTLRATSPLASVENGDELTGVVKTNRDLTTVYPRFSGSGMRPEDGHLTADLHLSSNSEQTGKIQLGLLAEELPSSKQEYEHVRSQTPEESYKAHVTAYNKWWADNIPYIETPEPNIDKTVFYRWWLSRFNFIDANMPGNTYQFPAAIEGVLGYNNSIVLTTCMFINDLKYLRDPTYAYGSWVAAGETSKSRQYVDNPGGTSWNNSYTQYITDAAWESFKVHGGPADIAAAIGTYGRNDVNALIGAKNSSFNRNGNKLIDWDWASMTGNDSDAVSFFEHEREPMDRAESAWVWANAKAASEAFATAGNSEGAEAMSRTADEIRSQILGQLWNPDTKLIQHKFIGEHNGQFAKWKENNNYYPYAAGLMPAQGDADYKDDYESALRLFADADEFPVFPFYTANQKDVKARAEANPGKTYSNNFSVINSVPLFRIYAQGIRRYHASDKGYISKEMFKKLLYWNAFAHYQGGDNRYPDQNEFWNTATAEHGGRIDYRSWIHHTQLGTTNWTLIEDVAGLVPRQDSTIELNPIAIPGWNYFTINNLSYHGQDMTIVWDRDGSHYHGPAGFSLYLSGRRVMTSDKLTHVLYDAHTGKARLGDQADPSATLVVLDRESLAEAKNVTYSADSRVTDIFAKAGRNIDPRAIDRNDLARGAQVKASFEAPNQPAGAAVDGSTINEPFWGTAGSPNATDSLEVSLAGQLTVDEIRLYFYKTAANFTIQGYAEPTMYRLEYQDAAGQWKQIGQQYRSPNVPEANYNLIRFPAIQTGKLRVTFTHAPGARTGLKEIEAYHTGIPAPTAENQPPSVQAYVSKISSQGAQLSGVVKDDGMPFGRLTTNWTQVSGPGKATFADPSSQTTTVKFNLEGDYVLRLTASDGQKESHADVRVHGVPSDGLFNTAPQAKATASYTNGYLPSGNVKVVNDGNTSNDSGTPNLSWNNWGDPHTGEEPWLQLQWPGQVPLSKASLYFWTDNGGVPMARSWKLQYHDAASGNWKDVQLRSGSVYGVDRDGPNTVLFDQVDTDGIRAVFPKGAIVGVSEFEAYAEDPLTVPDLDLPTEIGHVPQLPSKVEVAYGGGWRRNLTVLWPQVTKDMVSSEGEFKLTGTMIGASQKSTATVWVRSDLHSPFINGIEPSEQTVYTGSDRTLLRLPSTVTGIYNNGVHKSGLPVTWDAQQVAAIDLQRPGDYSVEGTVPDVAAGTRAKLTVHVVDRYQKEVGWVEKSATSSVSAEASWSPAQGKLNDGILIDDTWPSEDDADVNAKVWGSWGAAVDGMYAEYDWPHKITIDSSRVQFWANFRTVNDSKGGLEIPRNWKIQYLDENGKFRDVEHAHYATVRNDPAHHATDHGGWSTADFTSVYTDKLRLVLDPRQGTGTFGVAVAEWQVHAPDQTEKVDKTNLANLVKEASAIQEEDYTPGTWGDFSSALKVARTLLDDAKATQKDVDDAFNKLASARQALTKRADKERLIEAINQAGSIKQSDYTEDTVAALRTALDKARGLQLDPEAGQAAVDAATATLQQAIKGLKSKASVRPAADKRTLQKAVNEADTLQEKAYTTQSWQEFSKALSRAKGVLNDESASQDQVDRAVSDLVQAQASLQALNADNHGSAKVDKSRLKAVLDQAGKLQPIAGSPGLSERLARAVAGARKVLADPHATQTQVDAAINELEGLLREVADFQKQTDGKTGTLTSTGVAVRVLVLSAAALLLAGAVAILWNRRRTER